LIKRRDIMKKAFFLAFLIFIFQNAQAENLGLSEAYENEIIEEVKSVFQTKGIEEKVERPICATPIFLEIKANWDRFSPKTKSILESYTKRITYNFSESTYNTPQGHFKIHYVTQGDSAVPNEGWVHTCGEVLEHVWDTETGVLRYREPPSDGWYPPIIDNDTTDNGGDGRYDVYLVDLSIYYLGYTQGEYFLPPQSLSATSYIVLDNDYTSYGSLHSQIEWLQVTFAHEFFHAIQMGYDATEYEYENNNAKPYWMEMSAVWMEDMVYDDVNDYRGYLPSFFNHPEWSLKTFGYNPQTDEARHPYGSCVWPIYLSEKFGGDIIKDIWGKCAEKIGDNVLEATDAVLREEARRSTFEDAFKEFTVWNYLTGDRARTQLFYSEGDLFPKVKVDSLHYHTADTVYSPSGPNNPQGLGSNYIVFRPQEEQGGLKLTFSPTTGEYQITAVGYNENVNEPLVQKFQINQQTGYAETDVYNWTSYNEIIMIPAVTSRNADSSFVYTYSAEYDSSLHGEHPFPQKDYIGQNFPNPFVLNGNSDSTYFPFILSSVSEVEIGVFTISGERVWHYPPPAKEGKEWTIGDYTERGSCPAWDGKNEKGEYVASGIYLYQVKTKNSTALKKMAVIR
jgi:hypothetical protein